MKQYLDLVSHVLATGTRKENRTGVDTISTFNYNYEHDLRDGFPLLTTKAVSWKNIVVEMLWFLSGQTDISILKRHGCKFWDAWADPETGKVPSAYGNFWRQFPALTRERIERVAHMGTNDGTVPFCHAYQQTWDDPSTGVVTLADSILPEGWSWCNNCVRVAEVVNQGVLSRPGGPARYQDTRGFNDQIRWVLDEMKRNPMSRRMVVSAWAPGNAQTSKLPPCHCLFVFNVQNDDGKCDKPWVAKDTSYQDTTTLGVVWADTKEKAYQLALHKYGPQWESDPDGGDPMDCLVVREPTQQQYDEYMKDRAALTPTQRLCLHLTQRSCDVALGVPYNIASYAFLLHLFSRFTGIEPGIFAHSLVDAHIYTRKQDGSKAEYDHIPGLREQLRRRPKPLPSLRIDESIRDLVDIERLMDPSVTTDEIMSKFVLEGYEPYEAIPFKVAV